MSWEDFKKQKQQNSSWEEFKKKKENQIASNQTSNSSTNTITRKTGDNLLKNLPYSNSTKTSKVVQRDTSLLDKAKNLISNISNKISDGVNNTAKKITKTSLDFGESKRNDNQYEKYKAPINNKEEQELAKKQAVKQTQNAEQKVARKNSIESYNQSKKEREAQALVTDEQLLENLSKMSGSQRVAEIYNITKNNDDFNRLNNQVIQYQTMKKATEKANKINEDMTNGNYLSAIGHVAAGVPVKARDSLTTTMASINSLADAAGIVKAPTNSYIKSSGDDLLKTNKAVTNEYGQTTSQIDNGAVRTAANVSGTIGSMTPSIAASMILPGAGRVLQGVQVGADSYQENLNDDGSNRLRSVLAGAAKGYTSYALEGLTGGNVLSSGSLDDWAVKTIASKTSNKSLQKLASMVYEVGGEVLEEEVENNVDYVIDKIINNKDLPDFKEWWSETSETAKQTILSTLALKVLGLGGNTYKDVQEYSQNAEMNKWISEAEKIIEKENLKIDSEKLQQKNNINELLSQLAQNQQNTSTQQITPTIQNNVQNGISEQKNNLNDNAVNENSTNQKLQKALEKNGDFSTQVDKYIKGELPSGDLLYLGNTSKTLQELGLKNEPLILKQSKLKSMLEYSDNNDRLHGLPAETIKKIPEAINNPLNILKSSTHDNSIVVITDLADSSSRPIIASIEIDYNGQIGDIDFLSNRLTSAYGKNNYDRFMQTEIAKGNLLYDIDEGILKELPATGLQLSKGISSFDESSSFINNSIPQNKNSVKDNTITNNYMQNAENNSDSLKAPVNTSNMQVQQEKVKASISGDAKTPFRTSEQIANDTKISDIDAIKEESSKINTPTREIAVQTENNIASKASRQAVTSPTIDLINKKRNKEKATITEIKDTLAQKFVNKGHYIDKLAMKTGNKNLTYLYDRTMTAFTEAQVSIGDRQIITNEKGTDVEEVGKSIIDIFSEADNANLSNEFDDYLLNKHNIARYAHEKGIFGSEISATDSQNIVDSYEKQHPEFIKWSQEVSAYNDNNLKDLVRNGLVSKETYENLRTMYKDYVPTFRDITDNVQQYVDDKVGNNTLGKAMQSDKTILSVKESMAEQTIAIKKAIRMNNLGVELYKTLGKDSKVNESVSGIGFDPVAIQTLAGDVIAKATDGTNTFMIFQDGEMTEFKISNELYSAFAKDTLQNKINESKVLKAILTPAEKLSKAQRELLTTYSIGFAFNNPIKDFQDALFNTKYSSAQFLKNYTKALYNIGTDGSWFESYKNNGGTANTYFDYDKGILPSKNKKFGDKIKKLNNILEQAPRLAEYISTIENGGNIDEALYNAADITTNFKRGGDITKVANKYGANFLNASVQGLDKFYRNLSGQNGWKGYANLVVKSIVWQVAPAIINGLLLGDDEDYEDLPEYTKDNYFLFKIGDGKFFRIPKGRPSSVVGGIARRVLETAKGKEVDWKSLINTTINQMAPNNPLTDNIVAPIMQASKNKTWYGGEIVSSRLQKLPNVEQYDESTDEVSKWIAKQVDKLPEKAKKTFSNLPVINKGYDIVTSPKKLNYVFDQYSGGAGDVILPMLTPQAENNILEDKFTTDSVMKNKHVSEYYSKLEDLEKNKNSEKSTEIDQLKYMYLSGNSKELGELYQQKRDIQNSDLSDKEKKTQVREIQKQINDIVENKLENVDFIQKSGDTAIIGEEKYYKYKGEWKQLSEEEAKKIKGISLNTYANYQNKVATLSDAKKKKDESVTRKDKINILTNANYTISEKDKIYTQIINTDDNTYQILKKLDSNKNIINQYLDYLQADLEADREDDGTTKGKAISGSKKKKVSNYINSIDSNDMSYVQKLYLAGINTTLSTSEKKKLFTYINENKSLTSKEKMEALDKLQGFTVYKNGKVTW